MKKDSIVLLCSLSLVHHSLARVASGARGRAAAETARVGATLVELATGHADGARAAEPAEEARDDRALLELVLVGYAATEGNGGASGEAHGDTAHSAVVLVDDAVNGVALAASLAREAEPCVEALVDVLEAAKSGVDVGHDVCVCVLC